MQFRSCSCSCVICSSPSCDKLCEIGHVAGEHSHQVQTVQIPGLRLPEPTFGVQYMILYEDARFERRGTVWFRRFTRGGHRAIAQQGTWSWHSIIAASINLRLRPRAGSRAPQMATSPASQVQHQLPVGNCNDNGLHCCTDTALVHPAAQRQLHRLAHSSKNCC